MHGRDHHNTVEHLSSNLKKKKNVGGKLMSVMRPLVFTNWSLLKLGSYPFTKPRR